MTSGQLDGGMRIAITPPPLADPFRTGTGRTKAAEALAQTSQLLNGIELPFRSS